MADQKFKSARTIAVDVLNYCDPNRNYASTILDGVRHETDQSQRATDLVFGTLRNRTAIDTVIAAFSGRPVKRIQNRLLNIIRIGTYELIYHPSTEQYAIVNEAVSNAKASGSDKQAGFVNAVLRQITRHISDRQWAWPSCGIPRSRTYDKRTLPQSPVTGREPRGVHGHKPIVVYGCQFDIDFLPDSKKSPSDYLSTVFSLPQWLVGGWLAEFSEESARQICLASNRRPSVYIRPNRLKTTIEALTEKMSAAEVEFEIVSEVEVIRIKSPRDVTRLPGFAEGLFTIQDITASMPVRTLENLKLKAINLKFLDLCAAPGTKTTQLAEATGDSAKIIATDIDSRRLEMVKENIARLGIKSVNVIPYEQLLSILDTRYSMLDENPESRIEKQFDCILLDVPCSNTGVLARRLEARYRINPEAINKLSGIQAGLLDTAAKLLKPSGVICYSTCSIQKTENSEQIENFLEKNKNFTLEAEQLTLPSAEAPDRDGGYVAILVKQERK